MTRYGRFGLSTAVLSAVLVLGAGPASAQSMTEALASAYATNPDLAADIANLKAVNEGVAQALSGYRPNVSASASISSQFTNTTSDNVPTSGGIIDQLQPSGQRGDPLNGGGREGYWHEVNPATLGITITQNVYNGGQTEAAVNQAENTVMATRAVVQTTEQTVLLDAATAYADVVQAQAALDVQRTTEAVLRRQLQAPQDRFKAGEVTRTDVSQAEASLASATAGRIEAEGTLRASRATFERFIGQPPGTLETPAVPAGLPTSMQDAPPKAQANYPGIVAAVFTERAAADNIDLQFGALLPQLSLQARIQRQYSTVSHPKSSSGAQNRIDSAAIVAQLTIPLYSQGNQESLVRQARYTHGQRRIQIESQRRTAIQGAVQAWQALVTARAAIKSFQAAVKAEQLAVEGLQQEAQVGSRTVLDVLTEQQNLLEAQLSLVQARRNEVVAGYQLRNAIGTLTAQDMGLPVKVYDPEPDYQKTRARWFGTSVDE
ncbi:TolC family outer membrane protein [Inquilinus sp. Marseille-Q2685]|uniref:TolC family outer membrane protein n=1 Tax=Inquilinus sp. Marseille-Q2685 TaxID=2866581 RepID=UPI001CE44186|nr:TolC family outer membrane protein [Inquilinus sp. Marseille-Q2685]